MLLLGYWNIRWNALMMVWRCCQTKNGRSSAARVTFCSLKRNEESKKGFRLLYTT
jgi:hypothetical protein